MRRAEAPPEHDYRNIGPPFRYPLDDAGNRTKNQGLVQVKRQLPSPRVEYLERVRAGIDLLQQVGSRCINQPLDQLSEPRWTLLSDPPRILPPIGLPTP